MRSPRYVTPLRTPLLAGLVAAACGSSILRELRISTWSCGRVRGVSTRCVDDLPVCPSRLCRALRSNRVVGPHVAIRSDAGSLWSNRSRMDVTPPPSPSFPPSSPDPRAVDSLVQFALGRWPTILGALLFLDGRPDRRETTESERGHGPEPRTHVEGEVLAHALMWVHSRCSWPGTRNGVELWEYFRQLARGAVVDAVLREIVVPRLEACDARGDCRSLWRELIIKFPALKAELEAEAAAARVVLPWRPVDLVDEPDSGTLAAVRNVIPDWDGKNWLAVRSVLRALPRTDEQIDRMTLMEIRMEFAINQKPMIERQGGQAYTHTSTIVLHQFGAPPTAGTEPGVLLPGPAVGSITPKSASHPPNGDDLPDDATLSPASLLDGFGLPPGKLNALNKRLQRFRAANGDGWIENTEASIREARFLYKVGAVRAIVVELRATNGATSK